jgi:hypothetical protein
MKIRKVPLVSIFLVIAAFLVMLQQYLVWGRWWEWKDFLHHENFAFGLVCIAVGIVIAINYKKLKVIKVKAP